MMLLKILFSPIHIKCKKNYEQGFGTMRFILDPCMSDDGGSPRPPESQMDIEMGTSSIIPGPMTPVSPVPSATGKAIYFYQCFREVQ